jgi:hypothetical protein
VTSPIHDPDAALEERCRARQAERAGRREQTIGERLVADQAVLRALPEPPFEPCDKRPGKVSSQRSEQATPERIALREIGETFALP